MEIDYDEDFKKIAKTLKDDFGWDNIGILPDSFKILLNDCIKAVKACTIPPISNNLSSLDIAVLMNNSLEKNKIYQGDCLALIDLLADKSIDCVVTSPPYNLNKKASGGGNSKQSYEGWYADDKPEFLYQSEQRLLISKLLQKCKGSIFYNHRVRYAWHSRNVFKTPTNIYHPMQWLSDFPIWCEVIWYRKGTTGHANGRCRLADERIYQIGKPHVFHDMGYTTVWDISPTKNVGHVCTFPEELVERCILMSTNEGDLVLDPYMGSGTTKRVCERLGRRYIGFELEERYVQLASK